VITVGFGGQEYIAPGAHLKPGRRQACGGDNG
jgi:hypothetical protein